MQLFQFPNTSFKQGDKGSIGMSFPLYRYQVLRTVIIPTSIKVMHYPTLRQRLCMCLFPNYCMFPFIFIGGNSQKNITIFTFMSSTLPTRMISTLHSLSVTSLTMLRSFIFSCATQRANILLPKSSLSLNLFITDFLTFIRAIFSASPIYNLKGFLANCTTSNNHAYIIAQQGDFGKCD